MKRRDFVTLLGTGGSLFSAGLFLAAPYDLLAGQRPGLKKGRDLHADLVIAGGGLGGCACALAALRNGLSVIMTEQTGWIGGQLTQQGVPPDEHRWIESYGATRSYRDFRNALRNYYRHNYPLTGQARSRQFLNPGDGVVSRLCTEPRAAVAVLLDMLAPYIGSGRLTLLTGYQAEQAWMTGDKVHAIEVKRLCSGDRITLTSPYFADATELGDLLPLTGTEYVTGTEAQKDTSELHAPETADPANQQAFTLCFAMDYLPGEDHTLDKPEQYDHLAGLHPFTHTSLAWPVAQPVLSDPCCPGE
ncbi:MAG: FAD-dependent oxidoreductase [Mangrovibacterium sp.]